MLPNLSVWVPRILVIAVSLLTTGCGDGTSDAPPPTISTGVESSDPSVFDVIELLRDKPVGPVSVTGLLFDDGDGLVLCEVLAESVPPECFGTKIAVTEEQLLDVSFTRDDTVRWTDRPVVFQATLIDGVLTVGAGQ